MGWGNAGYPGEGELMIKYSVGESINLAPCERLDAYNLFVCGLFFSVQEDTCIRLQVKPSFSLQHAEIDCLSPL